MHLLGDADRAREISLDHELMDQLERMWDGIPGLQIGYEGFMSMVLCGGFSVEINSIGLRSNARQEVIFRRFYVPVLREIYKQIRLFGFAAICRHYLPDQQVYVPAVCTRDMGHVSVRVERNARDERVKTLRWYWNDRRHDEGHAQDDTVRFIVHRMPTADGRVNSAAISLLADYQLLCVAMKAAERAATNASIVPYFYKFNPPKWYLNDDDPKVGLSLPEEEEELMRLERSDRLQERVYMSRDMLMSAMQEARLANRPPLSSTAAAATTTAEPDPDAWHAHSFPLDPYYEPIQVKPPSILLKPQDLAKDLNQLGSAVAGIPFGLYVETHATRSANVKGNLRAANERIKDTIDDMSQWVKELFLFCNRERFKRTLLDLVRQEKLKRKRSRLPRDDLIMLLALLEVDVKMDCTPLMTKEELTALRDEGALEEDDYKRHLLRLYGLPIPAQLPDMRPPSPKRPRTTTETSYIIGKDD